MAKNNACKACGAKFATPAALAQHRSSKHGKGNERSQAPNPRRRTAAPRPQPSGTPMLNINLGRGKKGPLGRVNPAMLGSTEAGQGWALRALHPCDDAASGGARIPTTSTAKSAAVELRMNEIFSAPDGTTGNWDIQFMLLPFSDLAVAYRTRQSGGKWSVWVGKGPNNELASPGVLTLRPTFDSADPPIVEKSPTLSTQVTAIRQSFCGFTFELNSNSLTNQGMVFSGQYADAIDDDAYWLVKDQLNHPPDTWGEAKSNICIIKDVPRDSSDIVNKMPDAGVWAARQGVYMPMRFMDDIHPYQSDKSSEIPSGTDVLVPYGLPVQLRHDNEDRDYDAWIYHHVAPGNVPVMTTTTSINQQTGVVLFAGIDKTATVYLKMREGIEVQPVGSSPLGLATAKPPPDDSEARKAVNAIGDSLPMSYPARFNFLGAILPWIWKAASKVAPVVFPWLQDQAKGLLDQGFGWAKKNIWGGEGNLPNV